MRKREKRIGKCPRSWRGSQALRQIARLDEEIKQFKHEQKNSLQEVLQDPFRFLEQICRLKPYWFQKELTKLYIENKFVAVRWPRQTGKSSSISALLLRDAAHISDLRVAFIAPSWRQAKLNLRRVGAFCRNLPPAGMGIQRTRISFPNGSIIEAFPNNPDTIRGQTFHRIWIDEANFLSNDEEMYEAVLFALGTAQDAKMIASSTPFNSDSLFWKMCTHRDYEDYARHHFSWEKAIHPKGPLNLEIVAKIKRQFGSDPARWRREMEAEWSEDEDVWLPQSLIVACIGTEKTCGSDMQLFSSEIGYRGEFFAGLDLAQTRDYCVFTVLQRENERLLLRLIKIFKQPTMYSQVLGYIKMLQNRWDGFQKIRVDITREGPSFIKDMENAGIKQAEGVYFSENRKSEMAHLLKQRMANNQLFYPMATWESPYRSDICSELNVERYFLRKDGLIGYSHPSGTHDDVFWSIALACYASVEMKQFDLDAFKFG